MVSYKLMAKLAKETIQKYGSLCSITRNNVVVGNVYILSNGLTNLTNSSPFMDIRTESLMCANDVELETGDIVSVFDITINEAKPFSPNGVDIIYYELVGTKL